MLVENEPPAAKAGYGPVKSIDGTWVITEWPVLKLNFRKYPAIHTHYS